MQEKRNKIIIIILTILIIISSVIAIYFYIKNKETNELLLFTEKNCEDKISNISKQLKQENAENTTNEVAKFVPFDSTKIKNGYKDTVYEENIIEYSEYFELHLREGKVYIEFNKKFEGWPEAVNYIEINKEIELTGFDKKIVSCNIGKTNYQEIGAVILLFLMEDGTVEYISYYNALFKNSLKSNGKIQGLENIVRFANGNSKLTNKEGEFFDSSIFAIKNNGDVYVIDDMIK